MHLQTAMQEQVGVHFPNGNFIGIISDDKLLKFGGMYTPHFKTHASS